eukprot:1352914-Amorphochlora_amoeboformis.AAC.1
MMRWLSVLVHSEGPDKGLKPRTNHDSIFDSVSTPLLPVTKFSCGNETTYILFRLSSVIRSGYDRGFKLSAASEGRRHTFTLTPPAPKS